MEKKLSQLESILRFRCPHCHKTSMYENPALYTLNNLGGSKKKCDVCDTNLIPEPGFYFGAAYVNWMVTVVLWVSLVVSLKLMNALGWIEYGFLSHPLKLIFIGIFLTLISFPYLFRLSRSVWAHLFIK